MPKLSVIMGVYNVENRMMLEKAVNSILNQTFSDFDFIICNDGSNDETLKYIVELAKKDNRIKILSNEKNFGLAYSLNRCIEYSNSEYIARMDADDISKEDRLEKEIKFLDENDSYAVVACNANLIDENDKVWGKRNNPEIIKRKDFLFNSPVIHPTVIMRKGALKDVNYYRVSKETRRTEDYDLWMRLYAKGYKIYTIQEYLYYFREDEQCLKHRKYKYRIDEAKVRYNGYKKLKLLPVGYIYVLKPLIVGLLPHKLIKILRNKHKKENML